MTDPIDRRLMLGAAGLLGAAALSRVVSAGPLNPPAGPITSTGKTLTEIEPRTAINDANTPGDAQCVHRITQPGSYYLAGNIQGVAGKHGIVIDASGVTLDLMGFALLGVPGSLDGISNFQTAPQQTGITIRNGTITGFGGIGLSLLGNKASDPRGFLIERLQIADNGGAGAWIPLSSIVRDCLVTRNGQTGIFTRDGCVVARCAARENTRDGILPGPGSLIIDVSARQNADAGIGVVQGSLAFGCSAYENGFINIAATDGSMIDSCLSSAVAARGIDVYKNCVVRDAISRGHASGTGIEVVPGGSPVSPFRCRIERCNVSDNASGIRLNGRLTLLSRNTCSGNTTNWSVSGQNFARVVQATTSGAVNGNGGGVAPSTETSPHLNFTY